MKKSISFIEILGIPEARELVDQIEELADENEQRLVRIRESLVAELSERFGYDYIL